jgi:hypothetical protein
MTASPMPHSFKFSTRHLLVAIAAAAFIFWLVKNYYDSKKLEEAQVQLRAARRAGSTYLYEKLLRDEKVIGKKIAEVPGLNELSMNPATLDDRQLAEMALERGEIVRPAPIKPAPTTDAEGKIAVSQQEPTVTYVSGDRALIFGMDDGTPLKEGRHTIGFWVYIRNDKILAIFKIVSLVPS